MKKRKKLYLGIFIGLALIYIIMLLILVRAERMYGGSQIDGLGKAFWYSIVTLSTVGYGDLTPVSPMGHVIGVVFLLLSMGVLVTMFGTVMSFLTGEALPSFLLSLQKKRNWYYFADYSPESGTLARNILKEDPKGVIIFGEKRGEGTEAPDYPCLFLETSPASIVARKKNVGKKCKVFLMRENDIGANSRAMNLHELPVDVYARTTNGLDSLSGNIHFFHSYDCCARQYWQEKPICFSEQSIVIIGFGNYGKAILERAILTNVWSDTQHVTYHIFGDSTEFLEIHYRLKKVFSINEESEEQDSLIFHTELWATHHKILEDADRIIVCEDDVEKGWNIYWKLYNYYRLKGRVDLRNNRSAPGISYFGTDDEIYTPRLIMRTYLNKAAITINELFRKSVSYPTVGWDELDDFHRQSKIAAADHLLMKIRILLKDETIHHLTPVEMSNAYWRYSDTMDREADREMYRKIDHLRWCRFYYYYNWTWGPKRDDQLRQHPMLRPYDELTAEQKIERDQAWELLDNISAEMRQEVAEED